MVPAIQCPFVPLIILIILIYSRSSLGQVFGFETVRLRPQPLLSTLNDVEGLSERCVNLGSWRRVGPYISEKRFIRYTRKDQSVSISVVGTMTNSTFHPAAFHTRRLGRRISFFLRPAYPTSRKRVSVSLGFAQFSDCRAGKRLMNVRIGKRDFGTLDIFKNVGCNQAFFLNVTQIPVRRDGLIKIQITSVKSAAFMSVVCIRRFSFLVPSISTLASKSPNPSASPTPKQTIYSSESTLATPSASKIATPYPSSSRTPLESPSSYPLSSSPTVPIYQSQPPSISPTSSLTASALASTMVSITPSSKLNPSASLTPSLYKGSSQFPTTSLSASPSSSSPGSLTQTACDSPNCLSWKGRGGYKLIGNSMSHSSSRLDCRLYQASSAYLDLPSGACVKHAMLYWSASGQKPSTVSIKLNGVLIPADNVQEGYKLSLSFYGASANVTDLIVSGGWYTASEIYTEYSAQACLKNVMYAAWSLAVVYEIRNTDYGRITLCQAPFHCPASYGTHAYTVKCLDRSLPRKIAKASLVSFEGDKHDGEYLFINNQYMGYNLFNGSTAPHLDILTFDVSETLIPRYDQLRFEQTSLYRPSVFAYAVDGLFIPIYIVHQIL